MTPTRRTPVTLHDVAREAGVSLATASRALNGSARKVNEAYRERVLAAATKLSYSPNLSAQAVARGTTMTVALVVSDIADPYFSTIASGVARAAEESGLIVTIAMTERSPERELQIVRTLRGQRPRVIILAGSRFLDTVARDALVSELQAFEGAGGRVVMISQRDLPFATVVLDNRAGARDLATALTGAGYRRFAAVRGSDALQTSNERLEGFCEGLVATGSTLAEADTVEGEFTRDGGYRAMAELLARPGGLGDVELVFAVNDVMAVGAISALRDAGVEPGRDVAVAGFDDIATVRDITPALTTVRVPLEEMGARAMELALQDPDIVAPDDSSIEVSTTVVVRSSTPPRG